MNRLKHACDGVALCSAASTIFGMLPTILGAIASALSIAWYCMRWFEWYKGKKANNGNQ